MEIEGGVSPLIRIGGTQEYNSLTQSIRYPSSSQADQNYDGIGVSGTDLNHEAIIIGGSQQDRVEKAIAHLNKIAQESDVNVKMEYNKEADRVEIKFIDGQNNKVVKQIPSDSVLDMDIQIRKFIGVLFDKMI